MANGTTKNVWSIDPGVTYCGLSRFANGFLQEADYVEPTKGHRDYNKLNRVGLALVHRYLENPAEEVVIELPVIYQTANQKGDQADIRNLAAAAGSIGGTLSALTTVPVYYVEPSYWKGTIPKNIFLQRIWGSLTTEEQSAVKLTYAQVTRALEHADGKGADVLDSIGLGLFRLQRLNKQKIRTTTFTLDGVG